MTTDQDRNHLFCFGLGYSAETVGIRLLEKGWIVSGSCRSPEKAAALRERGFDPMPLPVNLEALDPSVTHVLVSVPPDENGDVIAPVYGETLARLPRLRWVGYLSTTGVYGDRQGALVDETSTLAPTSERGRRRVKAEQDWQRLALPLHIFRLAGIYGPGRSQLDTVRAGTARRIIKPGHMFSRIHVEDIATILEASMTRPTPYRVFNVCDDEAAPPQDVIAYAAELLGLPLPPEVPFETAELSAMARSFYEENKRVSNERIKRELGITLRYPTYREGLRALL